MSQKPLYEKLSPKDSLAPIQWPLYLLICLVGLIITGIMVYGFYNGDRIARVYAPLVDAAMEIKLETTTAHLWFEEILSGDRHEDMSDVWKHQDQAEWYTQAMLEGGKNQEGTYIPLDDAEIRRKIKNVQKKLREFRAITLKRMEMKNLSGPGSAIDQHYDHIFLSFLKEADEVETKLQQVIAQDLSSFRYTQLFLIIITILLFMTIGFFLYHFIRIREDAFQALNEAKRDLETEIIEHKRSEEALHKSENRYRVIFEESPISLWEEDFSAVKIHIDRLQTSGISDLRSYFENHPESLHTCAQLVKIKDVNRATLKLLHAESKEELLKRLDKIFVDESYNAFKDELIYLDAGKYNIELQSSHKTLQDNEIHILLKLAVVPGYEDTWSTVFVSLFDITERMEAEAELSNYRNLLEERVEQRTKELEAKTNTIAESQKALTLLLEDVNESRKELQQINSAYAAANQELQEFAYVVSHDLKAPLRAISQLTHWISEDYSEAFDDDGRKKMDLVLQRVKRMDGLIEGILQYSWIGRIKEEKNRVNLSALVKEIIDTLAPDTVQIHLQDKLPVVFGDPTRLTQLFQNLIENGIKYMDKDNGVINVGCVDKGAHYQFSVADNGPGIDPRFHKKIFQIFQTLSPRDKHESTGIGLTMVKKIVSLYGGSVWVESDKGHGATFFFTLPKEQGENNEKQ